MGLNEVVINTSRLTVVAINETHIMDVYKYFTRDITMYMYPQPTRRVEDTEEFVKTSMDGLSAGTNLQLVILKKETKEFIGCLGLHNIGTKDPELGVWVKKSAHSKGYSIESVRGVIKWAKENVEHDHIKCPVDRHNAGSRRTIVSLGGKFMKSYKKQNINGTKELDIVEYWI